tara:strand:+ start:160 stop:351 length:192 start_codon:yes stop_codon:yes gene_type:complete
MKKFFISRSISQYKAIYREKGLKALVKEKGWKVVVVVCLAYSIKGTLVLIFGKGLIDLLKNIF